MSQRCSLFFVFLFTHYFIFSQNITTTEWKKLVPSPSLPKEIVTGDSNNNIDLVQFQGCYYVAFRTAPTHFASEKTRIYVMSSVDFEHWDFELQIAHQSDLREPRFIEYHGKPFLYYFQGGTSMTRFEPKHLWMYEMDPATKHHWEGPNNIGLDGFVPWRLRTRNDTIYLSAYYGVGLYSTEHQTNLRLFISKDGKKWQPLSDEPQITADSGEEGEFIFDKGGNLWGTVRLESTGALLVHADKNHLDQWQTKFSKQKYDSALLFRHGDDIYLVSRRNMDGNGEMDKAPKWFPKGLRKQYNLLRYSFTRKKTALFKLNPQRQEMEFIMDFPSTGDTAFPAIAKIDDNTYILLNYSSDINGCEKNWIRGQLGKTYIYWTELRFQ